MISFSFALNIGLLGPITVAALTFSSAAMAQSLSASCDMGELVTIPLNFTEDMRPVAEAGINGVTVPAMIHIGSAQGAILNKKTLDRLGIPVREVLSTQFAYDGDSSISNNPTAKRVMHRVNYSVVDNFSFGATALTGKSYLVEDFLDDSFGMRLGAASLLQNDIELALDAGYLKSFKPDGCATSHLAYWDPEAVSVSTIYDPLQREPRPVFTVNVNGQDIKAMLSTATPHSYIPKAAAERLGLTPGSPGAQQEEPIPGHAADNPVWNVPVAQFSIGSLAVKNFNVRLMDLRHTGEVLILGADFLHRHRVYMAMSQTKIYFSPIESPRILKEGSVEVIPGKIDG